MRDVERFRKSPCPAGHLRYAIDGRPPEVVCQEAILIDKNPDEMPVFPVTGCLPYTGCSLWRNAKKQLNRGKGSL